MRSCTTCTRGRDLWPLATILLLMLALVSCGAPAAAPASPAAQRAGALTAPAARDARATPASAAVTGPVGARRATAQPTGRPAGGGALPAGLVLATPRPGDRMPTVGYGKLPPEAHKTLGLIVSGGPFPYRQDGVVFQNRESLLPKQSDGYYHEYTVVTPGSPDRGARRIIAGVPGEYYYTGDHYASFQRVVP